MGRIDPGLFPEFAVRFQKLLGDELVDIRAIPVSITDFIGGAGCDEEFVVVLQAGV